jgi:hypothetical protein
LQPFPVKGIDATGAKIASATGTLASIVSLVVSIAQRTPSASVMSGVNGFNVVLHLAILAAICYGVFWSVAERVFNWKYGAGGGDAMPSGWSAVMLAVSMVLPLAFVPPSYEALTGTVVLLPLHWRAMLLVMPMTIAAHLAMYGTSARLPNGIRAFLASPRGEYPSLTSALMVELAYSVLYFLSVVFVYRLVVEPMVHLRELIATRTLLPCLTFFFGMTIFIVFRPSALHDRTWIQVRGVVSGLLMMFCFCAGMFL